MSNQSAHRGGMQKAMRGQGRLTGFGFKPFASSEGCGGEAASKPPSKSIPVDQPIAQPLSPGPESPVPGPSRARSSSVLSDPSTDNEGTTGPDLADVTRMKLRPKWKCLRGRHG